MDSSPSTVFTDPLTAASKLFHGAIGVHHAEKIQGVLNHFGSVIDAIAPHGNQEQAKVILPAARVCTGDALQGPSVSHLVHYRGMIQDMHGPEFFVSSLQAVQNATKQTMPLCGLFRDAIACPDNHELDVDSSLNSTSERHVFTMVPIPGETQWCIDSASKYLRNALGLSHLNEAQDDEEPSAKAIRLEACKERVAAVREEKVSHLPLGPPAGGPGAADSVPVVRIKVYGSQAEQIKLNELYDVFGILSPSATSTSDPPHNEEESARHRPSLLPSLHVVHMRPVTSAHMTTDVAFGSETLQLLLNKCAEMLAGDKLSAQYLLCHLVSRLITRNDGQPVGLLPLNVFGLRPDSSSVPVLNTFLNAFVDKVVPLPLSLECLNGGKFSPKKDHLSDSLVAGRLQLAKGTHVLVDETKMEPGKLDENGLKNLDTLQYMISSQKVAYDFVFHTIEFDTDVNVLVASEGKSMLKAEGLVGVRLSGDLSWNAFASTNPSELGQFRALIQAARSTLPQTSLTPQLQQVISDDFVILRQENPNVDGLKLNRVITLARLLCALESTALCQRSSAESSTEVGVSVENWKKALCLEKERHLRLSGDKVKAD